MKKWGRHLACQIRWTENSFLQKKGRLEACPTVVFVNSNKFFNGLVRVEFPLFVLIRVDPRPSAVPLSGNAFSLRGLRSKSVRLRSTLTAPYFLYSTDIPASTYQTWRPWRFILHGMTFSDSRNTTLLGKEAEIESERKYELSNY